VVIVSGNDVLCFLGTARLQLKIGQAGGRRVEGESRAGWFKSRARNPGLGSISCRLDNEVGGQYQIVRQSKE